MIGAVSLAANGVKNDVEKTLILNGTPEQVEAAICAQFTDKEVQDAALESWNRRLAYIAEKYGHVNFVYGEFYLDAGHGNSIFPNGLDHHQNAQVIKQENGKTRIVNIDLTEVPQEITDNLLHKTGNN